MVYVLVTAGIAADLLDLFLGAAHGRKSIPQTRGLYPLDKSELPAGTGRRKTAVITAYRAVRRTARPSTGLGNP